MKPILEAHSASSKICLQIVLCSVNMCDLDIPQDLQVNKNGHFINNYNQRAERVPEAIGLASKRFPSS